MNYSIQVLQVGRQQLRGPIVFYLDRFDAWEPFVDTIIVVRGGGKTIVINSGLPPLSVLEPFWPSWPGERPWEMTATEEPATALASIGVDPAAVDFLILTPLVYYATGHIDLFSKAQICILKRGWADFHAPANSFYESIRSLLIPPKMLASMVTNCFPRLRLLEDEDEILPGIRTFFAGVHHRSSMAVSIDTVKGKAVFSDCFFKFRNIEENIPIGALENLDEVEITYSRIRREANLLIPMFDPELFVRYPGGLIAE